MKDIAFYLTIYLLSLIASGVLGVILGKVLEDLNDN